jgi:hypothetical protein
MTDSVLSVLINWKRPANCLRVLRAIREQSVASYIALVECSPDTEFAAPPEARQLADIVFTVNQNLGPCSRFIPPLALQEYRYTFFAVDDHVPGPRHLEWLLQCAKQLDNNFATIGQDGRRTSGDTISRRRVRMQPGIPTPCDFITSSELCMTAWLPFVANFRADLTKEYGSDISQFEDDLFLCFGIQCHIKMRWGVAAPCYLTPDPLSIEQSWRASRLHAPHALCGRENHHEIRDLFVRRAMEFGWSSRCGV